MSAESPSIVLVSARPATVDAVRATCSDSNGGTIQMSVVTDTAAVAPLVDNKQTVVVLLDCQGGSKPPAAMLKGLVGQHAVAPVILLSHESSPGEEHAMIEAGAVDVLPLAELTHGMLRRALRNALARYDAESKLARLMLFDPVSGLPTPILFWEILTLAVRRARRNRDFFSVLLIDFDWHELPADIAEHAAPVLYKRFADRIKALMRASDTVASFEKSQVVVLAESMPRIEDVQIVAAKILSDITAPTAYEDRYVTVSAAIGIAIYPTSGGSAEALIGRASQALSTSRERSTNRFAFG